MKLYFERKISKYELVKCMIPARSMKQVFSHFHKGRYQYERKFANLKNKGNNLSQLSEMLKVFRNESRRRCRDEDRLMFEDALTQRTLTVSASIFESLVKSQALKRQECESLNVTIDECALNMACQVKYLELVFQKKISQDKMYFHSLKKLLLGKTKKTRYLSSKRKLSLYSTPTKMTSS